MMVFGVGASTCGTKCERARLPPKHRGHRHHRPGRDRTGAANPQAVILNELGRLLHPPLETGTVRPNAVQGDCNLAGDCDLGLFRTDPLH
jgi:hypothetical protein